MHACSYHSPPRVEVPLPYIMEKRIAGAPGGVAGGKYTLRSTTGYTFEMEVRLGSTVTRMSSTDTQQHVTGGVGAALWGTMLRWRYVQAWL
jgi:hypothetical protein